MGRLVFRRRSSGTFRCLCWVACDRPPTAIYPHSASTPLPIDTPSDRLTRFLDTKKTPSASNSSSSNSNTWPMVDLSLYVIAVARSPQSKTNKRACACRLAHLPKWTTTGTVRDVSHQVKSLNWLQSLIGRFSLLAGCNHSSYHKI